MRTGTGQKLISAIVIAGLGNGLLASSARADDARSLEEVRNTVVNLLETLVQKGIVSREQATGLVTAAQGKAERDQQARAAGDDAANAVRVTYVPQIVKDEISAQVSEQLRPEVVKDVIAQAQSEQWGVPGALPDWIRGVKLSGDIRVREQMDLFAEENAEFTYLDFMAVNNAGGIGKAGEDAFLNTTEDRLRTRIRARLGLEAKLADSFSLGLRLSTGNFEDPVSTNQTLAQYGGRYTFGVEQAWLRYDAGGRATLPW